MKWSNCQPSSVRGDHWAGPRAATKSRIIMTPLQIFALARNRDFSSALIATPPSPSQDIGVGKVAKILRGAMGSTFSCFIGPPDEGGRFKNCMHFARGAEQPWELAMPTKLLSPADLGTVVRLTALV